MARNEFERLAVDQAEVAGVAGYRRFRERADETVEEIGGYPLEPAFAVTRRTLRADDLIALSPFGDHRVNDFGRVLQIGVHDDRSAAGGAVESGGDGDLMTEIARELDEPVAPVVARLALDHNRARVLGAIVDDDHLARRVEGIEQGVEPPQQHRDDGFLVEDRHDERIGGRDGRAVFVHEADHAANA